MSHWVKVEMIFMCKKYEISICEHKWSLAKKISVCLWVSLLLALSEHLLYFTSEINKFHYEVTFCNKTGHYVEKFIRKHLYFVLYNLPFSYNHLIGAIAEYLNFSYTFFWSYLDLFIILISIGMSDLYEKVFARMQHMEIRSIDEITWSELRLDHVQISQLMTTVNKVFGFSIMLACMNDGYFILIQMLNITV
jgi:gustatory receptor